MPTEADQKLQLQVKLARVILIDAFRKGGVPEVQRVAGTMDHTLIAALTSAYVVIEQHHGEYRW
jgi:hypothetical protein